MSAVIYEHLRDDLGLTVERWCCEFPDPRTGIIQVQWREDGRRISRSLKHRDWDRAKKQADEIAAGLTETVAAKTSDAEPEPLTLGTLFDIYGDEVTPTKSRRSRNHDRAMMKMFLRFFGKHRKAKTLSQRDWDRFIRARRAGKVGPSGRKVSDRTVERDLKLLLAILNWAGKSRDEEGRLLLESNPLRGLKLPKEKNPARVLLTDAEYEALLKVAGDIDWRFRVALVLAHETGHRIGAIRQLRWSDIDMEARTIRWRGEHEKNGYGHRTPMTVMARCILEEARRHHPGIGNAPVMPAPRDPVRCLGQSRARIWWDRAEKLAGLEPRLRRGWHSLRRKFASD